jgi:hypothetical protein
MAFTFKVLSFFIRYVLLLVVPYTLIGQCAKQPSNVSFSQRTTSSIKVKWIDTNTNPIGWEIEVLELGESPQGMPSQGILSIKEVVLSGLETGVSYQIYIRTVCGNNEKSQWNGPFKFEVALSNPSPCGMSLNLKDDNCVFPDRFFIKIDENGILGDDIFLSSVNIMIEHDWPADLKIELFAPNGFSTILSQYNGVVTDDFGDILDTSCQNLCSFSDMACIPIANGKPPYIGSFLPDTPLFNLNNSNVNGLWELRICDNSLNDIGLLKNIAIVFDTNDCQVVQDYYLTNIDANSANICWEKPDNCTQMRIFYGLKGLPFNQLNTGFIDCQENCFIINNLIADTEYQVILQSDCGAINSDLSCPTLFNTTCATVTEIENFDNYDLCEPSCNVSCVFDENSNWKNVNIDKQDWIIWNAATPTNNTGPEKGYNGSGNYIYTEADPNLCGIGKKSLLTSKCLSVLESNGCSMSFQYFMSGTDIGGLSLEISENNGQSYSTYYYKGGNQNNEWNEEIIDLTPFTGQNINLRFSSFGSKGNLADIALDEIKFYGPVFVDDNFYYVDNDKDGYGDENMRVAFCQTEIPSGYSDIAGDCDDNNPNIHPGATEIVCNLIDENCNGIADDEDPNNLISININDVKYSTCNGRDDGFIDISVSGGNGAPYNIVWSHGDTDSLAQDLLPGKYVVEVSDQGGCLARSDSIFIGSNTEMDIDLIQKVNPSCAQSEDGFLSIQINNGHLPLSVVWNNNDTTSSISGLSQGMYFATVIDSLGCMATSPSYNLTANFKLVSGFSFKKNNFCFGDDKGKLEISTQNGSLPYKYLWNTGDTIKEISNLSNGIYTVTVTDFNGCESISSSSISSPDSLHIQVISTEDPTCFDAKNGFIDTKIIGGKVPYTYEWFKDGDIYLDPTSGDNIYNLSAGSYQLAVFDYNGCMALSDTILITEGNPLKAEIDSIANTSCTLSDDGFINIDVTGGKTPIYYSWKGTESDTTFAENLNSGIYSFTAFDANNCKVTIPNINVLFGNKASDLDISLLNLNKCAGDSLAQLEIVLESGTAPFDYNWSIGKKIVSESLRDTIFNLKSGNYKITVTDAEGCISISNEINIPSISSIDFQVLNVQANFCPDEQNGAIQINAFGGIGDLIYEWNNQATSKNISMLANGKYKVTITDANDCKFISQDINITSPPAINITASRDHPDLGEANGCISLYINGGVQPYYVDWEGTLIDNQTSQCNLAEGSYRIYVTDKNNCLDSIDVRLDHTLSTNDEKTIELKIYPNPINDILNIESNENIGKINLYNISGKKILTSNHLENNSSLILDDFMPGIYILEILINGKIFIEKVIIL